MKDVSWKECSNQKLIDPQDLEEKITALKLQGKTIATLNGSFDLLHAGHLYIIYEASKVADVLLVALNSDHSIKQYKDPKKPIIPLAERLEMVTALSFVDYVTWFNETDPRELLKKIQPHIHVNGAEYGESCIEAETVKYYGGKLHLISRIPGLATSDIIKKIRSLCD